MRARDCHMVLRVLKQFFRILWKNIYQMFRVSVGCFLDDIIITGKNDKEHLKRLEDVFKKMKRLRITSIH